MKYGLKLFELSNSHKIPTLIGSGALLLWAIEPLLVSELINIPVFEALTIVFTSCFLLTIARLIITNKWQKVLQQKWYIWLIGTITICGSDFCYIYASHFAPIAHVDFIDYLWPCLLVIGIGFLPSERFRIYSIIGACLGVIGFFQLYFADQALLSEQYHSYIFGYGIALLGICFWGGYSIFSKYNIEIPTYMTGAYCGIGAMISFIIHLCIETTVMPDQSEIVMAVILGLAGPGLAYQLWDYGVKHGSVGVLSSGCYFARVCALIILVFFGKEPFSIELIVAVILTFLGILISNIDQLTVKNKLKNAA